MNLETELRKAASAMEQRLDMFALEVKRSLRLLIWATRAASLDTHLLAEMQRRVICERYTECCGCPFESFNEPDGSYACSDYCSEHPVEAYQLGRRHME